MDAKTKTTNLTILGGENDELERNSTGEGGGTSVILCR